MNPTVPEDFFAAIIEIVDKMENEVIKIQDQILTLLCNLKEETTQLNEGIVQFLNQYGLKPQNLGEYPNNIKKLEVGLWWVQNDIKKRAEKLIHYGETIRSALEQIDDQ